jgi:hypothetical protein
LTSVVANPDHPRKILKDFMTTQCRHCESQLEEGAVVCLQCGQDAEAPCSSQPPFPVAEPVPVLGSELQQPSAPIFSAVSNSADRELTGIGGWLILVAIRLAFAPLLFLRLLLTVHFPYILNNKHETYLSAHPASLALIVFEATTDSVFLLLILALNYLFYRKRKSFPSFMVCYLVVQLPYLVINHFWLVALYPNLSHARDALNLIGAAISAAIWTSYFVISRRVKLTFIR